MARDGLTTARRIPPAGTVNGDSRGAAGAGAPRTG